MHSVLVCAFMCGVQIHEGCSSSDQTVHDNTFVRPHAHQRLFVVCHRVSDQLWMACVDTVNDTGMQRYRMQACTCIGLPPLVHAPANR